MTTFTSEDRKMSSQHFTDPGINDGGFFSRSPWTDPWFTTKDYRQTEIEFFFPLTEQIPLGLDYTGCAKEFASNYTINNTITTNFLWGAVSATNISPTLSVQPQNSVGQLNIGGLQLGMEKHPTWYQRVVYKLLGFNWKDK
jgi:hypothetical protein